MIRTPILMIYCLGLTISRSGSQCSERGLKKRLRSGKELGNTTLADTRKQKQEEKVGRSRKVRKAPKVRDKELCSLVFSKLRPHDIVYIGRGYPYWKGRHGHENALLMVQTYQHI